MFVVLWCTGYIVARLAIPDAGPLSFLAVRYLIASLLLGVIAVVVGSHWSRTLIDYLHTIVVGILIHGLALGGVWVALDRGVETGVVALIMGSQPLFTAILAGAFLGERLDRRTGIGLLIGFLGVTLVIQHKLAAGIGHPVGLLLSVAALIGMTVGTLYHKRMCPSVDLVTGNCVQLGAAGVAALVLALALSDRSIDWTLSVWAALAWSVLVLSIGASLLLYLLLRRGAASRVASLFYLMPPITALMAWIGFGETIGTVTIAGMGLTAVGVAMVMRPPATSQGAGR